ncbi:mycothiol transferase [Streptomyces sp. NPDC055078]
MTSDTSGTSGTAAPSETDEILDMLGTARRTLLITLRKVTDAEAGERATVSELTLGGILNHLTQGERVWTHIMTDNTGGTPEGMWDMGQYATPAGATVRELRRAYEEAARATDAAARTVHPDTEVPLPETPWEPGVVHRWSVRRILLHLFQETAQHAGHADIIRESLDGASTTEQLGSAHE